MQTFLPYANFVESAECLDNKRLCNQRNEAWILYQSILFNKGWNHHPVAKMWEYYPQALLEYGKTICLIWCNRGFKDSMFLKFRLELIKYKYSWTKFPHWLGNEKFHASHRSNLLRKNYEWYSKFNWKEANNLAYYWPID